MMAEPILSYIFKMFRGISIFSIIVSFFCLANGMLACNSQDSQNSPPPSKKPNSIATSAADSSKFNPETWKTLIKDQSLMESDDLDPLSVLLIKNSDNSLQYCVGNYIGDRKLITAAHCLQGLLNKTNCQNSLLVEWTLKKETTRGEVTLSKKFVGCKSFLMHPLSGSSGKEKVDVALILLDNRGVVPKQKFELSHLESLEPGLAANSPLSPKVSVIIGRAYGDQSDLKFKKSSGKMFEVSDSHFASQIENEKGMSGSAVEYRPTDTSEKRFLIGIHFGGLPNTTFSLSIKTSAFLDWTASAKLD